MTAPRRFMAHDAAAAKHRADIELVRDCVAFVLLIVVIVAIASVS